MSRTTHKSRFGVETLDDRFLPSCSVSVVDGHTLQVLGDDAANDIRIVRHSAGVTVTCDRGSPQSFAGIDLIRVIARGGDDVVELDDAPGGNDSIWLDLGDGNDACRMTSTGQPSSSSGELPPGRNTIQGGRGNDRIAVVVVTEDYPTLSVPPNYPTFTLCGGIGNDLIDYATDIFGGDVECEGNDGDDTIRWDMTQSLNVVPVPFPYSEMVVRLLGGNGMDRITSRMGIQPTPFMSSVVIELEADGGAGDDTIVAEAVVLPAMQQGGNLPPVPPSARFAMSLHGDVGDDEITARTSVEPTPFLPVVDFNLEIDGGAGNDIMALNSHVAPGLIVGFNPQPEPPVLSFVVDMKGGAGLDRITSRMGIQPTPFLPPAIDYSLAMDGGDGSDVLDAEFTSVGTQQSVANLHVALSGGDASDSLSLLWTAGAFDVDAVADGGAGIDSGIFSSGVRIVNVERVN